MHLADELLRGAIDMHCHAYPEFSMEFPCRYPPAEHIALMREAAMGGVVLKSHFWPTIALAERLRLEFPDFPIFGSVTLNDCSGGMAPWVVEAAARQRAKVVWFPTWSAANDIERGGVSCTIAQYLPTFQGYLGQGGHHLTDGHGRLSLQAREVLALCKEYDLVACTGHIAPGESLALAACAREIGFDRLILSHPDSGSVGAAMEQITAFARCGGYIELCALGLTPIHHRITPAQMGEMVRAVGAERCVLSSDYFFAWDASSPEQLRGLVNALLYAGIAAEDLNMMLRTTPRRLLGMDESGKKMME